jgi:hypothetical protein
MSFSSFSFLCKTNKDLCKENGMFYWRKQKMVLNDEGGVVWSKSGAA